MMTLSIDPGVNGCGIAAWRDGHLMLAEYVKAQPATSQLDWQAAALAVLCAHRGYGGHYTNELVIERPQVYARRIETDPNDLITLALIVGAVAGLFRADAGSSLIVTTYLPAEHKGQIPKPQPGHWDDYIISQRVKKHLSPAELANIRPCAPSLAHNIHDAIWLGKYHLMRQGRWKERT